MPDATKSKLIPVDDIDKSVALQHALTPAYEDIHKLIDKLQAITDCSDNVDTLLAGLSALGAVKVCINNCLE